MLQSDYTDTITPPPGNQIPGLETDNPTIAEVDREIDEQRQVYFRKKNRRERILGSLLLIPATPIIGVCWLLVRLTSKGPGLFRQTRVGLHGEEFQVLKLRTMRIDAEANGPQWSSGRDPRVTPLGRWYRKLHLDELPQLINVVRGEMVLTGPRPERPEFVELLAKEIPNYEERLLVKPGITGLAQVNLPPDSDLESVEKKQTLDLHYISTASFWLDQKLLASTAFRVLLIRGKAVNDLLGVNKQHLVDHVDSNGCDGSTMLSELLHRSKNNTDNAWQDDTSGVSEEADMEVNQNRHGQLPNRPR